jgi:ATP-dependent DNA ligase
MELEGMVSKRPDSTYVSGRTERWLKVKSCEVGEFEIAAVQRGKPPVAYMVDDQRRYVGGAFVTLNQKLRDRLWERVTGKAPSPPPKGLTLKVGAEWVRPGLRASVRYLKGEDELRHATLMDIRDDT